MIVLVPWIDNDLAGGGGDRIRTRDPQLAKLVLYQLSYAPEDNVPSDPRVRPHAHHSTYASHADGGPEWIRTTYLALIRRVL